MGKEILTINYNGHYFGGLERGENEDEWNYFSTGQIGYNGSDSLEDAAAKLLKFFGNDKLDGYSFYFDGDDGKKLQNMLEDGLGTFFAKGGTTLNHSRVFHSTHPAIKVANFKDESFFNLMRLPRKKRNGYSDYSDNFFYAIYIGNKDLGKKKLILGFETLKDAESRFDELVDEKKKSVELREDVKKTQNYGNGGRIMKEVQYPLIKGKRYSILWSDEGWMDGVIYDGMRGRNAYIFKNDKEDREFAFSAGQLVNALSNMEIVEFDAGYVYGNVFKIGGKLGDTIKINGKTCVITRVTDDEICYRGYGLYRCIKGKIKK